MLLTIALRELRSLFLSPLAWSILGVVMLIVGYIFLGAVEEYARLQGQIALMEAAPGITEVVVAPTFGTAAVVLLLVVPLLTMSLIAGERRNATLPLLLASPISLSELVVGKYLGVMALLTIQLLLLALLPLSLLLAGTLDFGLLAANLLGLWLMLAAFAALGLFMSSLTAQPAVAAVGGFGALLLLWIVDWGGSAMRSDEGGNLLAWFSLQSHYQALLRGLFDSADLIYYLLFITTFLVLSIRRLDADRLYH